METHPVIHRLRVAYSKVDDTRFISHLDVCNTMNRALRRAGLPVAYTEGFSPRPRTAFGPPLPLFVEGERELADIELSERVEPAELIARMNAVLPHGIQLSAAHYVPLKCPSITASIQQATYSVSPREGALPLTPERVTALLAETAVTIEKTSKGTKKQVDIRPAIAQLKVEDGTLSALLAASPSRSLNIFDLLAALVPGFTVTETSGLRVVRTGFVYDEVQV